MSSGPPLASAEASVARVAVPAGDNHPLAAGAVTTTNAAQLQNMSPSRHHQNPRNQNAMPPAPVGAIAGAVYAPTASAPSPTPPPSIHQKSAITTPQSKRSGGISSGDTNISPSSKSLDTLADDFLSSKLRPILLRPNPLPRGEAGIVRLRTLVERRAWGDILKLASTLLNNDGSSKSKSSSSSKSEQYSKVYASLLHAGQHDVTENDNGFPSNIRQETVEIMMLQCNAWLKLRRYADLSKEVERWNFLKQNDVTARSIEWLPWGIHILAGQSREYVDDTKQATDILCNLREDIPTTECGWLASVDNALANIFIRRGEWRLAIGSLDRMIGLVPEVTRAEVQSYFTSSSNCNSNINVRAESEEKITTFLTKAYICEFFSRQGRILLQAGALFEAREVFEEAKTMWTETESSSLSSMPLPEELSNHIKTLIVVMPSLIEINDGLFYFAKSNYDHALQSFSKAIDILRKDGSNFHSKYRAQDWVGPAVAGCQTNALLYNEAVNNLSLCHLYMCNMKDAVVTLEELVRGDPTFFLTERVAFNLCTLYELGSDSAVATRNKRVLQLIAKRFFLHDVGPESFRVT